MIDNKIQQWFKVSTILVLSAFLFSQSLKAQDKQSEIIFLSGEDFEHPKEWQFMCTAGNNSGKWGTIHVPSQWELEGYGEYTYGRWYKELKQDKPSMEEGIYKLSFEVPQNYSDKHVEIVFEGVMTDTEVKVNGQLAGDKHQGGFYRFSYDISSFLSYGKTNQLEVHVYKHSANNSVNRAERYTDWWLFGGIYRPVKLVVSPKVYISRVALDPKANGELYSELFINGLKGTANVEIALTSADGKEKLGTQSFTIKGGNDKKVLHSKWNKVKTWSPENPNLYQVTFSFIQKGKVIHQKVEKIGFRTLEFKKRDGIYLNGTKLIVKGINRHTFWPESGRSTSKRISIMDADLIKDMNINTVRGHYPPDGHFLDVCDSLGILVMNELAGWQNGYDDEVGAKLIPEMINRDVNHPCVLTWAQGNEGGWNYHLDHLFDELDPQKRIVIHPWSDFNGWDTHHYPAYQTGVHRFVNGENVFLPTEFMHGMYDQGHGAGLEDFWDHFTSSPLFAGAVMWAFSDEAVLRTDWTGDRKFDSKGNLAPDGILGPHREKEGSYFSVKEIWSPIKFAPCMITSSFDGSFYVSNKYLETNLNECKMYYSVFKSENTILSGGTSQIIDKGQIELADINPGETRKVGFELSDRFFDGDWLEIKAFDKLNKLICHWTWPIHRADYYADKFIPRSTLKNKKSVQINESKAILQSNGIKVEIDVKSGLLTRVSNASGDIRFINGPVPVGMKASVESLSMEKKDEQESLVVKYKGGIDHIRWTMTADGVLEMDMTALKNWRKDSGFDGAVFENDITAFGITFDFPEESVEGMKWFGRGPYRVWKNRIPGTNYGVWEKDYNNTITGESFENLIYPEFKGYHANMLWAQIKAGSESFNVVSESDGVFLRMLTPDEPKYKLNNRKTMPTFPKGDISFLYEIPAIWSFKPIAHQGPKSQPSSIRIKAGDDGIHMKLKFDFRSQLQIEEK